MAVTSRSTALQSISRQSDGTWIRPGQAGGLLICCVIRNDAHAMQQVCVSGLAVSSGTCDRFSTSHTGVEGPSRARLGRSTRQGSHHDRLRLRTVLRRRRTVEFAHRRADACRPAIRGRPRADGRPPRGDASRGRPLRITGRHRSGTRHADRGAAGWVWRATSPRASAPRRRRRGSPTWNAPGEFDSAGWSSCRSARTTSVAIRGSSVRGTRTRWNCGHPPGAVRDCLLNGITRSAAVSS